MAGQLNCASDKPGSILDTCTSQLRHCVEENGTARCGGCIDDASLQDGVCVGRISCGTTSCLGSEYCDVSTGTPTCQPLPCAPGEAKEGSGACRACNFTCSGAGLSGRVWPFRTNTGTCICETTPGFFMPPGGDTRAAICDVDADGWVREEVEDPALTSDPALVANARCDLVSVDTVVLRDELGIDAHVVSCREGLLFEPEPTQCTQRIRLPLVESLRNDSPGPLSDATTPAYGGRRLEAREVNALTKACVSALGDFNDNGVEDLLEVQTPPARLGDDPRQRLLSFAYFMETQRAYVEKGSDGRPRLVIEERYRCDPNDFPLHYDPSVVTSSTPGHGPTDAYVSGDDATYWRSCTRGADPKFDPNADPPVPGFDFAQWSCPKGGAGCSSIAPGPPHPSLDLRAPIPFGSAFPEDATLCELGSRFPRDRVWRGMGHESQFKCLGVGDGPGRRPLTDFGEFGPLRMNLCEAVSCAPGDASCAESRPVVPGSRSLDPILHCRAIADVATSDVGFAAVRYAPYGIGFGGSYQGGCISEDSEYHDTLCPDPVFTVSPADDAFGANTCHIAPCPFGKADCDGNPLNGCELDATNNVNCGGCGVACAPARGVGDCSTGLCRVTSCQPGWEDCDHDPKNGCERSTRTLTDCGACNVPCAVSGGAASCATGTCKVANCAAGVGDCDAVEDCETPLTTNSDCGGCGVACAPPNGLGSCTTGTCQVTSCAANFDNCDHDASNGCESSLSSITSCGGCGKLCLGFHSVPTCTAGTCTLGPCNDGYGNCDGNPSNYCEQPLTSLAHCGQCNHPCALTGANATCATGTCALASCQVGRANCDSNDANGCEVNLAQSSSCGAAEDLGSFNADTKCGVACAETSAWELDASKSGRGNAWFKVRENDFSAICSAELRHRIKLQVPAGVDYDIVIWDQCGGTILSRTSSAAGVSESLEFGRDDTGLGTNDSFNYWIEIRFNSGSSCQEWSLSIEGRKTPC
ncbi:MAG: hypothetical protein U1F43_32540 [Myxococcota bacterium]